MKFKLFAALVLSALLTACGGHGFEGQWQMDAGKGANKMLQALGGDSIMTIGDDYIEQDGQRAEFEIFIRESNGKQYLVFKDEDNNEDSFEIVDNNTLKQSNGLFTIKFKRI